jgi:hypothetical protein
MPKKPVKTKKLTSPSTKRLVIPKYKFDFNIEGIMALFNHVVAETPMSVFDKTYLI